MASNGTIVTIDEKKKRITIETDMDEGTPLSNSGKTRKLASTGGFEKTSAQFKGHQVSVNLNVTIPAR